MEKNQLTIRGPSNGKMVCVDVFFDEESREIYNQYGDKMLCGCNIKKEKAPTPFVYKNNKLFCPECERELEIVKTSENK